jgi:hypothetical protein
MGRGTRRGVPAGRATVLACRAGLAVFATGVLAAAAGTPWAGALVAAGAALLCGGGWATGRTMRKR